MLGMSSKTAIVCTKKVLSVPMASFPRTVGVSHGPIRTVPMAYGTTARAASPGTGRHAGDRILSFLMGSAYRRSNRSALLGTRTMVLIVVSRGTPSVPLAQCLEMDNARLKLRPRVHQAVLKMASVEQTRRPSALPDWIWRTNDACGERTPSAPLGSLHPSIDPLRPDDAAQQLGRGMVPPAF